MTSNLFTHTNLHPTNHKLVSTMLQHLWCKDKPRATSNSQDSPRPRLMGSHHLLHIIYFAPLREAHIQMTFCPEIPKGESRKCQSWNSCNFVGLQLHAQTSDQDEVWSKVAALVESFPTLCCTPFAHTKVESILNFLWSGVKLPVLIPNLSFCHNLCCKCPNGSCEPILNICTSITFQWYKKFLNARCFDFYNCFMKV